MFGGDPLAVSLALVPVRLSVVPLAHAALVIELPLSGTFDGSGTPTFAPPKKRPPQVSEKKFVPSSASRCPHSPVPTVVVNEMCPGTPPVHALHAPSVVVVVVDVVVVVVAPVVPTSVDDVRPTGTTLAPAKRMACSTGAP